MIVGHITGRFAHSVLILVLVVLVLLLAACSNSNTVSASDIRNISEGLNCVCDGCDKVVSECDCETAEELTTIVKNGLSRGHSEE